MYSSGITSIPTHHFAMWTSENKSKVEISTCPTRQAEISQEYALLWKLLAQHAGISRHVDACHTQHKENTSVYMLLWLPYWDLSGILHFSQELFHFHGLYLYRKTSTR